jgi:hypothetical protein
VEMLSYDTWSELEEAGQARYQEGARR